MARNLTPAVADALVRRNVPVALLFEAEFATGTVRVWTGLGPLTWNGQIWAGLGQLVGLGAVKETANLQAEGLAIAVRGVTAADISLALQELRQNNPGSIRLAIFDDAMQLVDSDGIFFGEAGADEELGEGADHIGEGAYVFGVSLPETVLGDPIVGVIDAPKIIFKGRLDVGEIDDSNPLEPVINLNYENELVDLERPREWRYTDQHQKQLSPGDRGLEYVAGLQDKQIVWGRR